MKTCLILSILFTVHLSSAFASGHKVIELSTTLPIKDSISNGWIPITLQLKNTSEDTLTFLTHSCDYWGLFKTSKSFLQMNDGPDCYAVNSMFLIIPPHNIFTNNVIVKAHPADHKISRFKIIATLVQTKEKVNPRKASKETFKKITILKTGYIVLP